MDKSRRVAIPDDSIPINSEAGVTTSCPPQEQKAKKKPRKLAIRNSHALITPTLPSDNKMIDVETKERSLDSRVSALESDYHKLHKRTKSNTIEIGKLQASTKTAPNLSIEDRPQDKTEPSPDEKTSQQLQVDSFNPSADPNRHPYPSELDRVEELSDERIETISRSTAPAIGDLAEHNSVALKGSYKIPLPSTLSVDDVRAVRNGLAAASSVTREIATALRGGRSREDSVMKETVWDKKGSAQAQSTSNTSIDPLADASSPRSWTSLLNSCTKLVSNAANAIEMEAAVEAKGKETSKTRASTRQGPPARTNSDFLIFQGQKPTISPTKPSTRRASSVTAPTQSSASKNARRATGPTLTTQARTQKSPKSLKNVEP
ncbi:hypothetical protein E2P81_ATG06618 [Venturia nashicola]|nr:hypothetical protein E2P81_ATG06618 [Venturia nashicola]